MNNLRARPKERASAKWRSFFIGCSDPDLLRRFAVKRKEYVVTDEARLLMKRPAFSVQKHVEPVDTIILSAGELADRAAWPLVQLLDPGYLKAWSEKHAGRLGGRTVGLLPAEAGIHIRDQYERQPDGEILLIGMQPIAERLGDPSTWRIFTVEGQKPGSTQMRLGTCWAGPSLVPAPEALLVLRLSAPRA